MCFAPQRRALFRHLNVQRWIRTCSVFYHFDLEMCFAPQWRALFSTAQLPKVVRRWCVLYILTSQCASRHNSVHFFISHLASWLHTRRFSKPTFRPSRATNHWTKTQWIATFLPLRAPASSLFWPSPSLIFSLLETLHTSAFPSLHIVGSLTSKLPSAILTIWFPHSLDFPREQPASFLGLDVKTVTVRTPSHWIRTATQAVWWLGGFPWMQQVYTVIIGDSSGNSHIVWQWVYLVIYWIF